MNLLYINIISSLYTVNCFLQLVNNSYNHIHHHQCYNSREAYSEQRNYATHHCGATQLLIYILFSLMRYLTEIIL